MKNKKYYVMILVITIICFFNSLSALLNAISIKVLNDRLNALKTAENVKIEDNTCISYNIGEENVIRCDKNGRTMVVFTDKEGNVEVVNE